MNQPIDVLADDPITPVTPVNNAARLRMMQEQFDQGVSCENCGSNWFYEVECNRYDGSRYSSSPGGDLSVISAMPQRIRICLCGHIFMPNLSGLRGVKASQEIGSFMESIRTSRKARDFDSSVNVLNQENKSLKEQVALLEEQIKQIRASFLPSTPAPSVEAQVPAPSSGPIQPDPEMLAGLNSWNNEGESGEAKRGPGRPKKAA